MPRLHCLNPCRRYPKCRWGLYASPPPVAMAVVGLFLLSSFFCEKKKCTRVASGEKKSIRGLHQEKKCAFFPLAFFHTRVTPKKNKLHGLHFFPNTRVAPKKKKYTGYTFFHTRVTAKKKVHGLHFFPNAGYIFNCVFWWGRGFRITVCYPSLVLSVSRQFCHRCSTGSLGGTPSPSLYIIPVDVSGAPHLFVVGEGVTGGWGVGVGGSLGLSRKMPEVGRQP